MKDVFCPAFTVWLVGCVVIVGGTVTVRTAALDVAEPALLVATARYRLPDSALPAPVMVNVAVAVPLYGATSVRLVNAPPLTDTCHW